LRLLLDTHAVLWYADDSRQLSETAAAAIESAENEVFISAVVPLEIAIKRALGKLEATDLYLALISGGGARELPIGIDHARAVESLPDLHGDPFDRLLIAQAQVEGAVLVTNDPRIQTYPVETLW
jgi:PIN domain nuclease of toxin-antitoxin system